MKDYGLSFAVMECVWLALLLLIQRSVRSKVDEPTKNLMDQGPWWSVAFHRIWLACHLPALMAHLGINTIGKTLRFRKEVGLPLPAFHAVNYGVILVLLNN
jgi:hypothetical protein